MYEQQPKKATLSLVTVLIFFSGFQQITNDGKNFIYKNKWYEYYKNFLYGWINLEATVLQS